MNKKIMSFVFVIVIFLITILFLRVKSQKTYISQNDIKIDKYINDINTNGYLFSWNDELKEFDKDKVESTNVNTIITLATKNKSNRKGYETYYLEIESKTFGYYKIDETGKVDNKSSYLIFEPTFYDSNTGLYLKGNFEKEDPEEIIINYDNKEYKLYVQLQKKIKENDEKDWIKINDNLSKIELLEKYYYIIEVPYEYKGLLLSINGAYDGYYEDNIKWNKINGSEKTYLNDSSMFNKYIYKVEDIVKKEN